MSENKTGSFRGARRVARAKATITRSQETGKKAEKKTESFRGFARVARANKNFKPEVKDAKDVESSKQAEPEVKASDPEADVPKETETQELEVGDAEEPMKQDPEVVEPEVIPSEAEAKNVENSATTPKNATEPAAVVTDSKETGNRESLKLAEELTNNMRNEDTGSSIRGLSFEGSAFARTFSMPFYKRGRYDGYANRFSTPPRRTFPGPNLYPSLCDLQRTWIGNFDDRFSKTLREYRSDVSGREALDPERLTALAWDYANYGSFKRRMPLIKQPFKVGDLYTARFLAQYRK